MIWLNRKGFTLVEIMIVVAIIGLLAAIAIPNFVESRRITRKNLCINNLRLIHHAKEQVAMDQNLTDGAALTVAQVAMVDAYIRRGAPSCPSAGTYTYGVIGTDPTCTVTEHVLP